MEYTLSLTKLLDFGLCENLFFNRTSSSLFTRIHFLNQAICSYSLILLAWILGNFRGMSERRKENLFGFPLNLHVCAKNENNNEKAEEVKVEEDSTWKVHKSYRNQRRTRKSILDPFKDRLGMRYQLNFLGTPFCWLGNFYFIMITDMNIIIIRFCVRFYSPKHNSKNGRRKCKANGREYRITVYLLSLRITFKLKRLKN